MQSHANAVAHVKVMILSVTVLDFLNKPVVRRCFPTEADSGVALLQDEHPVAYSSFVMTMYIGVGPGFFSTSELS